MGGWSVVVTSYYMDFTARSPFCSIRYKPCVASLRQCMKEDRVYYTMGLIYLQLYKRCTPKAPVFESLT